MDDSDLLHFTPVPLRTRGDGWTAKKQYFFILGLARGFSAGKAASILGMTRKTAYELRARPDGQGFRAAWAAAKQRARERRQLARPPSLAERALHGEWHPRLYRGQLVGWVHRPAGERTMGLLKRLDSRTGDRVPTAEQLEALQALTECGVRNVTESRESPNPASTLSRSAPGAGLGKGRV
jgi:hypothetical protein